MRSVGGGFVAFGGWFSMGYLVGGTAGGFGCAVAFARVYGFLPNLGWGGLLCCGGFGFWVVCTCCGSWVGVRVVVVSDGTFECFVSLVVLWFLDL